MPSTQRSHNVRFSIRSMMKSWVCLRKNVWRNKSCFKSAGRISESCSCVPWVWCRRSGWGWLCMRGSGSSRWSRCGWLGCAWCVTVLSFRWFCFSRVCALIWRDLFASAVGYFLDPACVRYGLHIPVINHAMHVWIFGQKERFGCWLCSNYGS